jgi:hypothetical protein
MVPWWVLVQCDWQQTHGWNQDHSSLQLCFTMNGIGWSWQLPESIHVVRMRALQWERGSSHHPITPETLAAIATKGSSIFFPESFCIQFQASISNPWILECRIFTPLQLSDTMRISIICSMMESLLPICLKGWENLSSFCNSWKLEWPLSWTFQGCFSHLCFVLTRYLPFAIQIWED